MKTNRSETIGIVGSVLFMILALYFFNSDAFRTLFSDGDVAPSEAATTIVSTSDSADSLSSIIANSVDERGTVKNMIIDDIATGTGAVVKEGSRVLVHYIGTLRSGQQFDNSYLKGEPFSFTVGNGEVIAGWELGVTGMQKGGQRILIIPPDLAYGQEGFGPIPPNATLVFAVELIDVVND